MIRKEKEENKKRIRLNFFFLFKPDQVPRCLDEGKALGRHVKLLSSQQYGTEGVDILDCSCMEHNVHRSAVSLQIWPFTSLAFSDFNRLYLPQKTKE